ncbi:MAG: hypothetical protein CM1200mP26_24090 [Acidimicrobiales bacterium]|nr:MAG: hypothetical protein CM1200mP26_24090 [Acidimicrobiales bacterium]
MWASGMPWLFKGVAGGELIVRLTSSDLDVYLRVYDPAGALIGDNDNTAGTNSYLKLVLCTAGTYTITADGTKKTTVSTSTTDYTVSLEGGGPPRRPRSQPILPRRPATERLMTRVGSTRRARGVWLWNTHPMPKSTRIPVAIPTAVVALSLAVTGCGLLETNDDELETLRVEIIQLREDFLEIEAEVALYARRAATTTTTPAPTTTAASVATTTTVETGDDAADDR